jgi:hypothetical protein
MTSCVPRVPALLAALLLACSATPPEATDFGSFMPPDTAEPPEITAIDVTSGQRCHPPDEAEEDLSLVGQMLQMHFENLWPGDYVPHVQIRLFDWCENHLHTFETNDIGSFAFHFNAGIGGFDGWLEYPHKPEWMEESEWKFGDYPIYREFDKPFEGTYAHINLRLFDPKVVSLPLTITGQEEDKGYIQGTLYQWFDYHTIEGAVIEASSGVTTYISNASLPDMALGETQEKGLFLIANTDPGLVVVTVRLSNGNEVSKTVLTWPLGPKEDRIITNVGFPIPPEVL